MIDVLIIDDDAGFRSMLRDMLEELDCRVIESRDGVNGIERLGGVNVDLVFTDILMPNQDGLETIQEVRRRRPGVQIIAISGGGSTQNMTFLDLARELGADHTLQKPIDFDAVAEILRDRRR